MSDPGPALATTIADYFKALVKQGLERAEALDLTRDYQADILESQREREQ
jgi:hypothetical protein